MLSSPVAPPGTEVTAQAPVASSPADAVYGWLRYDDSGAPRVYPITRPQTVIGRGGKTFWVDVKLNAPPDVSREHCRIRRDPATGRFFLKDVSQFGTTLDGVRVPPSLSGERDTNVEVEVPDRATISLADVFTLRFEAAERK
jgi:pSer/pThr/pTyr-binding forkhead associated (FHA) protein